jgi:hypothetical protein
VSAFARRGRVVSRMRMIAGMRIACVFIFWFLSVCCAVLRFYRDTICLRAYMCPKGITVQDWL